MLPNHFGPTHLKQAQELKGPITSYEKLCNSDHNILLFLDSAQQHVLGYLKYGRKDLFFYEKSGKMRQLEKSLCLLDFYVLETQQRNGIGKALFDYFLQVSYFAIFFSANK